MGWRSAQGWRWESETTLSVRWVEGSESGERTRAGCGFIEEHDCYVMTI